jgi:hypothetical protein
MQKRSELELLEMHNCWQKRGLRGGVQAASSVEENKNESIEVFFEVVFEKERNGTVL